MEVSRKRTANLNVHNQCQGVDTLRVERPESRNLADHLFQTLASGVKGETEISNAKRSVYVLGATRGDSHRDLLLRLN